MNTTEYRLGCFEKVVNIIFNLNETLLHSDLLFSILKHEREDYSCTD